MERRVETNQIVRLPFLYTVSKSNNIVVTWEPRVYYRGSGTRRDLGTAVVGSKESNNRNKQQNGI